MQTNFFYMDEQYANRKGFPFPDTVALTGVLFDAEKHRPCRQRFYELVHKVVADEPNVVSPLPEIHASCLFPNESDDVKIAFLDGLIEVACDLDLKVYRVGYSATTQMLEVFGHDQRPILGLCYGGLLEWLKPVLASSLVWPVMEIDRNSLMQDQTFAGMNQYNDYVVSRIGPQISSIDGENLGEVHYVTKRSIYGSITDCFSYILDAEHLRASGAAVSPFKARIADLAAKLKLCVLHSEVINMQFGEPPASYSATGPYRYAFRIKPSD